MKFRWQVLAALSILPFGVALADYTDLSKPALPALGRERSVEHQAFVDIAQQSLEHATQSAHELAIAVQNARRAGDMLLVTCLTDAQETVRAVQTEAIANLGRMNATTTVVEARAIASSVGAASKQLHDAMENAARCATSEEASDGKTMVTVERNEDATLDPGANDPGIGLPDISLPPAVNVPPTIDVMEPGTDMPMVPPTASPMR